MVVMADKQYRFGKNEARRADSGFCRLRTVRRGQIRAPAFDDEIARSLFKAALIQGFCSEQVSARDVAEIFAQIPALRTA